MLKYAQIIDEASGLCDVGVGTDTNAYQRMDMELMDVEQAYNGSWYLTGYAPVQPEPTTAELAERVRAERDARITACDWIISRHFEQFQLAANDTTLTDEESDAWLTYRQELRDLPSLDGFPWDGGAEETPWPVEPV